MKKQEFLKIYREEMPPIIHKKYRGQAGAAACAAMELCDMDHTGQKFWRKYRSALRNASEPAIRAMFQQSHNDDTQTTSEYQAINLPKPKLPRGRFEI